MGTSWQEQASKYLLVPNCLCDAIEATPLLQYYYSNSTVVIIHLATSQ